MTELGLDAEGLPETCIAFELGIFCFVLFFGFFCFFLLIRKQQNYFSDTEKSSG
jgi:preprotein translocase subunit YajC